MTRRSLFELLGCSVAAKAAGIPEPEKVERLAPGTYVVFVPSGMNTDYFREWRDFIQSQTPKGVEWVFMSERFKLTKLVE